MSKPILPPACFTAAVALMAVLHFALPLWRLVPWPWKLLAIPPVLLGAVVNIWADQMFKRAGTTVKPFEQSTSLISGGPFAMSRHPMYVGMTAILLGIAVALGTLTPMLVVPAFALVMAVRFIPAEERMMEEQFGREYREYCTRVRRWL